METKVTLNSLKSIRPRVLKTRELQRIVAKHKSDWGLSNADTWAETLEKLTGSDVIRKATLHAESEAKSYRPIVRFLLPECTPLEIASSIAGRTYLSHGTAVYLHGLTDLLPRRYYINREQSPKPPPAGPLSQSAIDRAFRAKARQSRYTFAYEGFRYTLLSGKFTDQLGVVGIEGPSQETLQVTDLERTLIDITVRPDYASGLVEVLSAYEASVNDCDPAKLFSMLKALNYKYPYHQAVGYLMERAGFSASAIQPFDALPKKVDFYLGYGARETAIDSRWRLHIPQGF